MIPPRKHFAQDNQQGSKEKETKPLDQKNKDNPESNKQEKKIFEIPNQLQIPIQIQNSTAINPFQNDPDQHQLIEQLQQMETQGSNKQEHVIPMDENPALSQQWQIPKSDPSKSQWLEVMDMPESQQAYQQPNQNNQHPCNQNNSPQTQRTNLQITNPVNNPVIRPRRSTYIALVNQNEQLKRTNEILTQQGRHFRQKNYQLEKIVKNFEQQFKQCKDHIKDLKSEVKVNKQSSTGLLKRKNNEPIDDNLHNFIQSVIKQKQFDKGFNKKIKFNQKVDQIINFKEDHTNKPDEKSRSIDSGLFSASSQKSQDFKQSFQAIQGQPAKNISQHSNKSSLILPQINQLGDQFFQKELKQRRKQRNYQSSNSVFSIKIPMNLYDEQNKIQKNQNRQFKQSNRQQRFSKGSQSLLLQKISSSEDHQQPLIKTERNNTRARDQNDLKKQSSQIMTQQFIQKDLERNSSQIVSFISDKGCQKNGFLTGRQSSIIQRKPGSILSLQKRQINQKDDNYSMIRNPRQINSQKKSQIRKDMTEYLPSKQQFEQQRKSERSRERQAKGQKPIERQENQGNAKLREIVTLSAPNIRNSSEQTQTNGSSINQEDQENGLRITRRSLKEKQSSRNRNNNNQNETYHQQFNCCVINIFSKKSRR